jgi:predicted homoserine dehydrogenase-like protein
MNLHTLLAQRTEASGPIKVGLIGAGKFASMFLTQALYLPGIHVVGIADLAAEHARRSTGTNWLAPGALRGGQR